MNRKLVRALSIVYYVAVAAILVYGAWMRFSLAPVPFMEADSPGYLIPALQLAEHGEFIHRNGRPIGYGYFMGTAFALGFGISAVVLIQHTLGLATCLLVLLTWERYRDAWNIIPALVHRGLGLAVVSVLSISPSLIYYEHTLLSEALSVFYLSALVFFLGRFTAYVSTVDLRGESLRSAVSLRFYAESFLMLFIGCLSYVIKAALGLLVPAVAALVFVFAVLRFRNDEQGPRELRWEARAVLPVVVAAVLAASLTLLPERLLAATDSVAKVFSARILFAWNAPAIEPILRADVRGAEEPPYDREELRELLRRIEGARAYPTNGFPISGFNPEMLMYNESYAVSFLQNHHPPEYAAEIYMHYVRRALWSSPEQYVARVWNELRFYFSEDRLVFNERIYHHRYETVVCENLCAERGCAGDGRLNRFCRRTAELADAGFVQAVAKEPAFVATGRAVLDTLYAGRFLLFFGVALIVVVVRFRGRAPFFLHDPMLAVLVRDGLAFCVCAAAVIVAVALSHSYSVTRFIEYQQSLTACVSATMTYAIFTAAYEALLRYLRFLRDLV